MGVIRAGQQFGRWVTSGEKALGQGGNGEVWEVTAEGDRTGAIKVLLGRGGRLSGYRLGRFRDEIQFLQVALIFHLPQSPAPADGRRGTCQVHHRYT